MSSVNKAIIVGRLGKDVEIFQPQGGGTIAKFSVATSEKWKGKDGTQQEKTEWHNIVIFNEKQAELAEQYLTKGSMVYLEGKITTRKWRDKDGNDRWTTEIVLGAFDGVMRFLSSKGDREQGEERAPSEDQRKAAKQKAAPSRRDLDDEVPF